MKNIQSWIYGFYNDKLIIWHILNIFFSICAVEEGFIWEPDLSSSALYKCIKMDCKDLAILLTGALVLVLAPEYTEHGIKLKRFQLNKQIKGHFFKFHWWWLI